MSEFTPCEVEAHFQPDGRPVPQVVHWRGRTYRVLSQGRRWQTAAGQHMLVKLTPRLTLELRYSGADWSGRTVSGPPPTHV